jgi:hypothetical protein
MPSKFFLFEASPVSRRFLCVSHHASLDGWALSGFLKAILETYHRIVTGRDDLAHTRVRYASTLKEEPVPVSGSALKHALFALGKGTSALEPGAVPVGEGRLESSAEHWVKLILSPEETDLTVRAASQKPLAFVDIVSAALIRSVDVWNDEQGLPRRIAKIGVPVQMRGRHGPMDASVNISFILVTSPPEDRHCVRRLAASLAQSRETQFRLAADVRTACAGDALLNFFRLFPLNLRRRMTHGFWQLPFAPMLVSSFGVLWPLQGRPGDSKRSAFTNAGDLEVSEVHILGYKHAPKSPVRLLAFTFRGRLNVVLWTSNRLLAPHEARRFSGILRNQLITVADHLADGKGKR